ncbi:DNA polymerase III subunit alpha [Miltoncostaea oceani]|uniref:DNA polymerase III subunit alpha n=1 Tax=Miltoncostaea oceani TaxID=2843216 RepID=UPI001C3D0497|nr:DNA polymerase III subunit alpha [Miltoncostaea oceani]
MSSEPEAPAPTPENFCHLHVHSEYSSLDGACKIPQLVALAKERGHVALGLSDHGTISGLPAFEKACRKEGIKPILSVEAYLTDDRAIKKRDTNTWHLGLIARTSEGLRNLYALTSRAYLEGYFNKRARADWELLGEFSEGLIALTGCMAAPVMSSIFRGDLEAARAYTKRLTEIFGLENVYGEIQNVGITEQIPADSELAHKLGKFTLTQTEANRELALICADLGVPLLATGDVHYLRAEDAVPHDALLCVGTGQQQARRPDGTPDMENRRFSLLPKNYHFRTESEVAELLPEFPEALANTLVLAERCDAQIAYGQSMLPRFPLPEGFPTSKEYLRHLCELGMEDRYGPRAEQTEAQRERLEFELGVIDNMGFNDYFLIVWDFVREAIERGIPSGPGRGSAAGAIVAYALRITHLDPLQYDLLFERFLNPDRISMPDVDWDVSIVRREEMIEYVRAKYNGLAGCDTAVAQIITHGMIQAKAGLRDAARVLGKPISLADRLCKMVPDKPIGMSLREVYRAVPDFQRAFDNDAEAKEVITLAGWMEGFIRSEGVHAAGVVIWDQPLERALPIQRKGDEAPITTSWDMKSTEAVGALKMDFLGLRNLDIIQRAIEIVGHTEGIELDAYGLPLDDLATYEMLSRGEAIGVFQLECVAGDTILNGDPRRTIAELHENPPEAMLSVDLGEGARRRNRVLRVVATGEKRLYRMRTAGGYLLRATEDHRILTDRGWQRLGDLSPGDQVVVNRRDASRIGACTDCGKRVQSRGVRCRSCSNRHLGTGPHMARTRDPQAWSQTIRRGADNPWWGHEPVAACLEFPDLDHPVRSVWEADFARALIAAGVAYDYEPRTFRFADGSGYTPDFYLGEIGLWVEVKGKSGLCGRGKLKVEQFRREFPDQPLRVVSAHEIAEFELAHPDFAAWNCPKLPPHFEFEPIIEIVEDAIEPTFDVMMEGPLNNYVANGVVVHNSGGMREALRLIKPTVFDDIIALVALYRPGPMEYIPTYAARKHGQEEVTFLDPRLESIIGMTYGVAVYQEQLMLTARQLGGFTPGQADTLRKAIGKKDKDLMATLKPAFVAGCVANGVRKADAEQLWSDNEKAGDYSFNKAHAAAYGLLAYSTAYLKCNHPAAYMAALMSLNASTKDKVPFFITEARRMGLKVLPPDLNRSLRDFAVMEAEGADPAGDPVKRFEILFGLQAIKGVGDNVIRAIRTERETRGPYRSLPDLIRRLPDLNKTVLERLVLAGALDFTKHSRMAMAAAIEPTLDTQRKAAKAAEKAFLTAVTDAVAAGGSSSEPAAAPSLFDAPAGAGKPRKLSTEEKRGLEAIAKASYAANAVPSRSAASSLVAAALEKEALRKARLAARKEDAEDPDARAAEMVQESAPEREAVLAALVEPVRAACAAVLSRPPDDEDSIDDAMDDQLALVALTGPDWPSLERLSRERKVLGLYASGHPLDESRRQWRRYISHTIGSLNGSAIGRTVTVVGSVTAQRVLKKKTGETFGLEVEVEDLTGSRPVTFFSDSLDDMTKDLLVEGSLCVIKAKVVEDAFRNSRQEAEEDPEADVTEKAVKLNGITVYPWRPDQVKMDPIQPLEITLPADRRTTQVIARLQEILESHPGASPVSLIMDGRPSRLGARVEIGPSMLAEIRQLIGEQEVALQT